MLFDLSTLAIPESAEVQLKHPVTNEPLFVDKEKTQIVGIQLASKSSAEYREAIDALQQRYLARKGKVATPEENKQESLELLLAVSLKGVNFAYNGKELASAEDFKQLYEDPKFYWVKDKVDEALGEVANFLKQ